MKKNQKKLAKARSAKPGKARRATPALSPSLSPSTAAARPSSPPPDLPFAPGPRGGDTLSIEAMLRAQLEATHLAAMDCLHRATTAESPELRDRALTHATRLLALFTRQVNVLERRRPPPAAPRTESTVASRADTAEQRLADATAKALADAAAEIPADDPAGVAAFARGHGGTPARQNGTGGGGGP